MIELCSKKLFTTREMEAQIMEEVLAQTDQTCFQKRANHKSCHLPLLLRLNQRKNDEILMAQRLRSFDPFQSIEDEVVK